VCIINNRREVMRTLTVNEVQVVSGGWVPQAVGAVIGGVMTYAERADDGDMTCADWAAVGAGAAAGAAGGSMYKGAVKALSRAFRGKGGSGKG
jgi:lactobin A/cerein 7B family class IIb bacteriocin